MLWENIVIILLVYVFIAAIGARLVVPYFGFRRPYAPKKMPNPWEKHLVFLKGQSKSSKEFLINAFNLITAQYKGGRRQNFLRIWRAFGSAFNKKSGYLTCNMQNYLLHSLLIKSGYFKEKDIRHKYRLLRPFIHQWLEINLGGKWIIADPWARKLEI
ncbi:MAG: hypothetical protein COU09_02975 [Candidatus Harrisonbacteria bacterium CG10_big_fil_rev_8_21_14_0_10_44_23]|uniref:Transglutaminase-like domain-containing protein n=1 Tax=Candidatus Harrisonbacteria bacterium CG10_big_fil_rev_8_21_14_0_10_44_23 TaxID=1974585 RepID=A0A2H0UPK1_9BACT|nr:MAG: hypothetical protein COU09_02975 [Candidatus Harrisonbacteria bacterium CG10_big_fil_rev_8_21_14_0_10_44_23]